MGVWRGTVPRIGLDLGDGGPILSDLRFVLHIVRFAPMYGKVNSQIFANGKVFNMRHWSQ